MMAAIKSDKISLNQCFTIDLDVGWTLTIDRESSPTNYVLSHGKKSVSFNSTIMSALCLRQYGIRLVKGRKQMHVPSNILQSFVDYSVFLQWYDPTFPSEHVTDIDQLQ